MMWRSNYTKRYMRKKRLKKSVYLVGIIILGLGLFFLYGKLHPKGSANKNSISILNYVNIQLENPIKASVYPDNVYGVPVHTQLIEDNLDARPMTKRIIKYIVIHETDNFVKGTDASNHARYLSYNNDSSTSWHYTVDDHEIYHHLPDDEVGHHAGDDIGNLYGIGIELCVNSDGNFNKTFDNGAKLVAYLLKAYNLDVSAIKMHHDFTGKDCPHSIIAKNRMPEFIKKVEEYLV